MMQFHLTHILSLHLAASIVLNADPMHVQGVVVPPTHLNAVPTLNRVCPYHFCATPTHRVCFRTREQLPAEQRKHFRCCRDCLWGWCCCEDHWQQHKQQHAQHCREYAAMSRCRLLECRHRRQHGVPLHVSTAGKIPHDQQMPSSWQQYKAVRRLPTVEPTAWL
jgi:hypothetical protein